jgi:ATPase subunit of ABC transporter with duplicated ATPase domains
VQASPKARQAKSKARMQRYEELLAQETDKRQDDIEIQIPQGPRLGDDVVVADRLKKGFGESLLIEDLTFRLPKGGIVGVIGPNGAGKTTLFRMITGTEQPDGGTLKLGATVKLAYVDQSREAIHPDKSVWQQISLGADFLESGKQKISSRAYTSWFGFKGSDQQKLGKELSGGERNRLHLAMTLKTAGNLLLLDEPTNDLDVDTLRSLEEALYQFAGCAVVVSHDRWFLDRVATHILAFEGDAKVVWFEGNYQAYEADQPHRIRYKKLTH